MTRSFICSCYPDLFYLPKCLKITINTFLHEKIYVKVFFFYSKIKKKGGHGAEIQCLNPTSKSENPPSYINLLGHAGTYPSLWSFETDISKLADCGYQIHQAIYTDGSLLACLPIEGDHPVVTPTLSNISLRPRSPREVGSPKKKRLPAINRYPAWYVQETTHRPSFWNHLLRLLFPPPPSSLSSSWRPWSLSFWRLLSPLRQNQGWSSTSATP